MMRSRLVEARLTCVITFPFHISISIFQNSVLVPTIKYLYRLYQMVMVDTTPGSQPQCLSLESIYQSGSLTMAIRNAGYEIC